ncbi:unnamed protein product [Bursaphelenchus xylophilus]|uniref:(pine wood nematode) hypothetical protein n=1 Tax=Bursaphelenchus xylophilus TaxID=6326 RepID=A0A7I8X0K6_BURXY|nr:unnamed protein product [Bursaphelenchus xylophilus]CAG9129775.1 unnamed protein product [Bursaphelenchus xylophilus]
MDTTSPLGWSSSQLAEWLSDQGFEGSIVELLTEIHGVDGPMFVNLTENDLRQPPVALKKLGDIKNLMKAQVQLKSVAKLALKCEHMDSLSDGTESTSRLLQTASEDSLEDFFGRSTVKSMKMRCGLMTKEELIRSVESPDTHVKSWIKLLVAFFYCLLSLWITALVMVVVHDRVPDMKMYPPLPDLVLDNLPLIPWAFELCELIGVALAGLFLAIIIFHKHRVVILRRCFSLFGTVFLLRCVTMLITSLSVPGVHLECTAKNYDTMSAKIKQAYHIWSHLGMSIQGVRTCGDYMFSGHTTSITLLNHFITEYTPEDWYGLHTMTWVLNIFGIFFILAGHEHYSIDVFVAFYISSRLFLFYHTYAYHHANLSFSDWRVRVWYPLGWFFESGSAGRVVNEFEIPFMDKTEELKENVFRVTQLVPKKNSIGRKSE